MKKVSVIIPVHNTEKYLPTCLNSVLNQTEESIEVIAINDHSTDHSLEILNEFQKMYPYRLKVVDMQEKRGVSAARNLGLNLAQGEFIGFVDSDDFISLNMYKDFYKTATQYNVDIVIGNHCRVLDGSCLNEETFFSGEETPTACDYSAMSRLIHYVTPAVWDKLFSHGLLENYEFLENHIYEDVGFTYPLIHKAGKIMQYYRSDYAYRITNGSIMNSSSKIQPNILDIIDVCDDGLKKAYSLHLKENEISYLINVFTKAIYNVSEYIDKWPIKEEEKQILKIKMLSITNYYFPNLLEPRSKVEKEQYKLKEISSSNIAFQKENLKRSIQKLERKYTSKK